MKSQSEKKKKHQRSSKHKADPPNGYLRFTGVAFELVIFNLVVVWGGYKLDQYTGTKVPWFIIVSVFLSVAGTIFYLFKRLDTGDE
ncbi:MAG: AtpZ/AtpI family protein [Bacteroidota bacterium]